jgi:hypothetical protein
MLLDFMILKLQFGILYLWKRSTVISWAFVIVVVLSLVSSYRDSNRPHRTISCDEECQIEQTIMQDREYYAESVVMGIYR